MNGATGSDWRDTPGAADQVRIITDALDATLDPRVSNDVRQQALQHLEQVKLQPHGPYYGYALASDTGTNDAVRYFGLQLLEFGIRYRWSEYGEDQAGQLQEWVQRLALGLRQQDALYLRNKVAQLWAELAKRRWGDEWKDMDAQLVQLWADSSTAKSTVNKVFVLYVLETLSEDIIISEDTIAGLRVDVLGAALNAIMVPPAVYAEHTKPGDGSQAIRYNNEGWLATVCSFFADYVKEVRTVQAHHQTSELSFAGVRALNTLRSAVTWISLSACMHVNFMDCLCLPFYTDDLAMQVAATEVLYSLLSRLYNAHNHETLPTFYQQVFMPDRVMKLREAFEQASAQRGESDVAYTLQKKISEVLSLMADALYQFGLPKGHTLNIPAFLDLLIIVLQSKSLVVSIPVLHSWSKLIPSQNAEYRDLLASAFGPLLQVCSERLLRYEALPADFDDEITQLLDEDFDTVPERHAFLGNYRRYCTNIVQTVAGQRPVEALSHVLGEMSSLLQNGPYSKGRGFSPSHFSRSSAAVLRFDAQSIVVAAALKGFSKRLTETDTLAFDDPMLENNRRMNDETITIVHDWVRSVFNLSVHDPEVAAHILQTLVYIVRNASPQAGLVLPVVQHILTISLAADEGNDSYLEAARSFESLRVLELQKLALKSSNDLIEVYGELESRVETLVAMHSSNARVVWGYRAFLFMITHRASTLDHEQRIARLRVMLSPVYDVWSAQELAACTASLPAFCEALGLGSLPEFYRQAGFDKVQDWSAQELDDTGRARQTHIKKIGDSLPLRMTASMLAAATEKIQPSTESFDTASALWADLIPNILPVLLSMIRQAQAFHNMSNWSHLPEELLAVIKRTLQDRFWQSGISNESKDEFYARISGSKTSYEGFASVVRGTMRTVRDQAYQILYLMTKFEEPFYGMDGLSQPLADALFDDASSLSTNHLHSIINLTTGIVQSCPRYRRSQFLPPLLKRFFTTLDGKISAEWEVLRQTGEQQAIDGNDELSDEMRVESVLRQLTFSVVSFVSLLLADDHFDGRSTRPDGTSAAGQRVKDLIIRHLTILEPVMLFCTHVLRIRDTRCCSTICKVIRSLLPLFLQPTEPGPEVREFISVDMLKASIVSLNDAYFVDVQKDLAALIAKIIFFYASKTNTVREVLCSLPQMRPEKVDKAISRIARLQSERQQRAVVLDLLEGVRGVSIHEAGKIASVAPKKKDGKAGLQQQYTAVERRPALDTTEIEGLESIAGLFEE